MFTGVKVFSATKAREREELGENVTRWLKSNADLEVVDRVVCQSSDNEFHCYSLVLFYRDKPKASSPRLEVEEVGPLHLEGVHRGPGPSRSGGARTSAPAPGSDARATDWFRE